MFAVAVAGGGLRLANSFTTDVLPGRTLALLYLATDVFVLAGIAGIWSRRRGTLGPAATETGRARPVSYTIDIDPGAQGAIAALPVDALLALAEAFAVLELEPWSAGRSVNPERNPDSGVRNLPFGDAGMVILLVPASCFHSEGEPGGSAGARQPRLDPSSYRCGRRNFG